MLISLVFMPPDDAAYAIFRQLSPPRHCRFIMLYVIFCRYVIRRRQRCPPRHNTLHAARVHCFRLRRRQIRALRRYGAVYAMRAVTTRFIHNMPRYERHKSRPRHVIVAAYA